MKTVKIKSGRQLRQLVESVALRKMTLKETVEITRKRLDELYDGSSTGSFLKQAIAKIWEADNMVQRALSQVETNEELRALQEFHAALEDFAFKFDEKVQKLANLAGKPKQKRPLPKPPAKK